MTVELFPYQREGAQFLASKHRAGLFDGMGLGKTAQAIAAMDLLGVKRAIVVCPAAVREVWKGEFAKFGQIKRRVVKGLDIHSIQYWLKGKCDVLLLSYEMAVTYASRLQDDIFDVLILDESHYTKSSTALRTRVLLGTNANAENGIGRWAVHVWFLTGTPMSNSPVDLWPYLRFTKSCPLTKRQFLERYFTAHSGGFSTRYDTKREMLSELRTAVKSSSIRRLPENVGLQLPPIWLTNQLVDGNTEDIKKLLREHPGLANEIVKAVEMGGLSFLEAQHIGTLRRLVGEAKAPAFAEMLLEELNNGLEKCVVFGIHLKAMQTVRDKLTAAGIKSVVVNGGVPEEQRAIAVRAFQSDPEVRVFLGNIRAAGTGLTLTAAHDITLMEADWSPAANAQALKRVHRIGQGSAVRARFITLANSIDEYVNEVVKRKTGAIAQVEGVDYSDDRMLNI